jgi:hypothetical protein
MIDARRALGAALTVLALAACTDQVAGRPAGVASALVPQPSGQIKITPTARIPAAQLPAAGKCLESASFRTVECASSHDAEVVAVGELPAQGDPTSYPLERDLRRAALPPCRAALADHLGSTDSDATRLQVWAFWPSPDGWAAGDRWRLCAVVELSPDGKPVTRTGSVKGLLAAAGFGTFQLCSAGSPSAEQRLTLAPCDGPHLAEAVPGVLSLGKAGDPAPSEEQVNAAAKDHCTKAVAGYVGAADRTDVFPAWRTSGAQGWSEGFTSAVCYAEATRPFTGRLWGIGRNALPG